MSHPFRPNFIINSKSSRSTETPMDFIYEKSNKQNKHLETETSSSNLNSVLMDNSPSCFQTSDKNYSSIEPPRKRMHHETESMDWESSPNVQTNNKPNLFPNPTSTRPFGGTFLFNPPSSLPLPPVYTHPSSITSTPLSLPSPDKFRPESYGLHASPRSVHPEYQEGDSSLDIENVVLQPSYSSNMYSNNAVKHENRRRTRTQRQVRSKLSQLSFHSDCDDDQDSDVEIISNQKNIKSMVLNSNHSKKRQDRSLNEKNSKTTNNYLTIHGWKGTEGSTQSKNQSHLSTDTPYILLVYLQLLFNSALVVVVLYLAINLILIIRADINHKFIVQSNRLRQEIELCFKEYTSNRCFPVEQRTKFIEKHCNEWESCMNRDPNLISRSKIGAETFAEVMNGFVDMISWKTMLFIFLSIGAGIYATNLAMNNYKSKWEPHDHQTRLSPWKSQLFSRVEEVKDRHAPRQSIDTNEIFGQTGNSFNDRNNSSSNVTRKKR